MSGRYGDAVYRLLSGWAFPTFMITTLVAASALMGLVLVFPAESTPFERFAEELKVWCFGLDPESGELSWGYVLSFLTSPLLLAGFTAMIWWTPLRDALRGCPRRMWRAAVPALALVLVLAAGMGLVGTGGEVQAELPFPAERLRTTYAPPAFELMDQEGEPVSLEALRGRVVIVTGVYATCGLSCPMILAQARRVVAGLAPEELRDVTVVAITLDPEHDTPETMRRMAEQQGVASPFFRLASGEPRVVNALLDDMGFERSRDPETGVIDHANLFLLVDRDGRIAYRFSLGERQERWLEEALELLLAERPASS